MSGETLEELFRDALSDEDREEIEAYADWFSRQPRDVRRWEAMRRVHEESVAMMTAIADGRHAQAAMHACAATEFVKLVKMNTPPPRSPDPAA